MLGGGVDAGAGSAASRAFFLREQSGALGLAPPPDPSAARLSELSA